jgi:hypothetical protein
MKNSVALVIGNSAYQDKDNRLLNAVNDAVAIAAKLETLDYEVILVKDANYNQFKNAILEFEGKLDRGDVGLFYYAGHGLEVDAINFLTATDTDFSGERELPYSSFRLDDIINKMSKKNLDISILILDACRNNPFRDKTRGLSSIGFASVFAPRGTLIAYSTSPGQTAKDGIAGGNSMYTAALLLHIDAKFDPIEMMFKKTRTSVFSLTGGKQVPWEHSSLIGDYYFNYGQRKESIHLPYDPDVVRDEQYIPDDSKFGNIITGLKSYNWEKQNPSIERSRYLGEDISESEAFLLGRNILQCADGGSFVAQRIFEDLSSYANRFGKNKKHIINGILFEIYFNSKYEFRIDGLKSRYLAEVLKLEKSSEYKDSFAFIAEVLLPYADLLFYIPGTNAVSVPVELLLEKGSSPVYGEYFNIESINSQGIQILDKSRVSPQIIRKLKDVREVIAMEMGAPVEKIKITPNIPVSGNDGIKCYSRLRLSKVQKDIKDDWDEFNI